MKKNIIAYSIAYIVVVIAVTTFSHVKFALKTNSPFPKNTLIVHYDQGQGDKTLNMIQATGISPNAIEDTKNIVVHETPFLWSLFYMFIRLTVWFGSFVIIAEVAKKFLERKNLANATV